MKIKKAFLTSIFKGSRLLGVNIGRGFVRLVELSFDGERFCVEYCMHLARHDKNSEDLAGIIKKALKSANIKTKLAASSFSRPDVILKDIDVANNLSISEVDSFLRFNLAKEAGLPEQEIVFDYQIVSRGESIDGLKAVVAGRKEIKKEIDLFKKANLQLKIIDVDLYAIKRALRHQIDNADGLLCVVMLDNECRHREPKAKQSRVSILAFNNKEIVYLREDFIDISEPISLVQLAEYVASRLELIIKSLAQKICQVVLAGEYECLFDLAEVINSQINISAIVANPFLDMDISPAIDLAVMKKITPMMLVSCGLALRIRDG